MQRSGTPMTDDSVAERTNDYTQRYAAAVVQLGQELSLPVVNLWSSMQTQPDWQNSFLCDGLHLTPAGNAFVYDQLQLSIDEAYPDLRYELVMHCERCHHRLRLSLSCHHVLIWSWCSGFGSGDSVQVALFQCTCYDIV